MFKPTRIYYEENIVNYPLGQELLEKYKDVPKVIIDSHNSIKELQNNSNDKFVSMKKYLIIGTRKTHKYTPNFKTSDYIVPFTSSGCSAFCLYCYLVCNYNKCSYLRLFVNRDEILNKLIKISNKSDKELTFEIGSNSDLLLENTITNNLEYIINRFVKEGRGFLTFPTKFSYVDSILNLDHKGRIIVRMSVNPDEIIKTIEFGTSPLKQRVDAINKLCDKGYKVGIIIAPVILVHNYKELYKELFTYLNDKLSLKAKESIFIEIIFMTYSYIHRVINADAFPKSIDLYDKQIMTARGRGKYTYNTKAREEATTFLLSELEKYFKKEKIIYIV